MLFGVGALGALLMSRAERLAGWWAHGFAILGSIAGLGIAASVLLSGQSVVVGATGLMSSVPFSFLVDGLAAFFLGVVSFVVLTASLYGLAYQNHFTGRYSLASLGFFFSLFAGSLTFVPLANDALTFFFFWEIMSLSSYFLVMFEHREEGNMRAGFLYLVMMHIGAAFILLAFLLAFAATGSLDFDLWRETLSSAAPLLKGGILLAAVLGFGIKAGIVPLHIWLPEAHPAAPSHVSALMSGVMIKTAIFMLVRFFFDYLPGASLWWGIAILVLGGISSVLGVLYALSEHDIKRLLAYHSVENIGIILLGIGSAIIFAAMELPGFALIALAAAFFHTMNHAIFKALLFLGAGSVVSATGTRNMEEYGGLLRLLPYTALFFLIGSLAISAFPPLNGFASERLTFQALFAGLAVPGLPVRLAFVFAIASLALTGGLAAACFVKAFGVTFLARSRAHVRPDVHEASPPMLCAMGLLAAASVLLGVFAVPVSRVLAGVALSVGQHAGGSVGISGMLPLMPVVLVFVAVLLVVAVLVTIATRGRAVVYGKTWDCGTPLTNRMEITGTGFSRSLMTIFRGILRPTKQVSVEYHDEASRYFTKSQAVQVGFADLYRAYVYGPVHEVLLLLASRAKRIQNGNVNAYILYVFMAVVALLIFVAST